MMKLSIFSFFAGVGFLDLGFENAGFEIVFVNEYNQSYMKAYKYARNGKKAPKYGYGCEDVRAYLSDETWSNIFSNLDNCEQDIVGFIGGPPCPDFSVAGRNKGEYGDNGQLTAVYVNLIIKRNPDFFVFENVKGLYMTQKHREFYDRMKRKLYRAGYSLFDSIENSIEYGTPQYRDRLILIGLNRHRFGSHIHYQIGQYRKYKISDINKMPWPTTTPFFENGELGMPIGIQEELTVEYWFRQNHVESHPNSHDKFNIKSKTKYYTIPEGKSSGKSFKRLHRWRYAPTSAYGNNEVHLHPYLPRRINVAEALAIQSLPETFILPGDLPLSVKYKMIGNGVPYLLAFGIASELYKWLDDFQKKAGG